MYTKKNKTMSKTKNLIVSFIAGAAAGAITGVLLAPNSGKDTRKKIANKAGNLKHTVEDQIEAGISKISELTNSAISTLGDYGIKFKDSVVETAKNSGKNADKAVHADSGHHKSN